MANKPVINFEDFSLLQSQLVQTKTEKYELQEKLKKLTTELDSVKKAYSTAQRDLQKAQGVIQKSRDKQEYNDLVQQNEHLISAIERMREEHGEQQSVLQSNNRMLFTTQTQLQQQVAALQAELDESKKFAAQFESQYKESKEVNLGLQAQIAEMTESLKQTVTQAAHQESVSQNLEALFDQSVVQERDSITKQTQEFISRIQELVATAIAAAAATNNTMAPAQLNKNESVQDQSNNENSLNTEDKTNNKKKRNKKKKNTKQTQNGTTGSTETKADSEVGDSEVPTPEGSQEEASNQDQEELQKLIPDAGVQNLGSELADCLVLSWQQKLDTLKQATKQYMEKIPQVILQKEYVGKPLTEIKTEQQESATQTEQQQDEEKTLLQEKSTQSEQKAKELQKQVRDLEEDIDTLRTKLRGENQNSIEQQEMWKEKNRMKQATITRLETEAKELSSKYEEKDKELQQCNQQLTRLKDEIAVSKQHREAILKALSDSEVCMNQLRDENAKRAQTNHSDKQRIQDLTTRTEQLTKEVADCDRKAQILQSSLDERVAQYQELQIRFESLEMHERQLSKNVQELEQQNTELLTTIASKEKYIKTAKDENIELMATTQRLENEKLQIMTKCQEYLAEMTQRENILKLNVEQLCQERVGMVALVESWEKDAIRRMVADCIGRVELRQIRDSNQEMLDHFDSLKKFEVEAKSKIASLEAENVALASKIEETKLEQQIRERKSVNMIKELKSQLAKERGNREKTSVSENQSVSDFDAKSVTNSERAVSSSRRSIDSINSIELYTGHDNINDVVQENVLLVQRLGELQSINWELEQKLRYMDQNMKILLEDNEKKKELILYYVQREKMGRIEPEHEHDQMERSKKGGFMAGWFGGKGSSGDSHIQAEAAQRMHSVMQETLLKNMQLQKDLKTLGAEITRLLEENKQLRETKT